jgi:hypothetical protein
MKEETISIIISPLVKSGVYKNKEVALKDIIANHIENKINNYEKIIQRVENKYGMNFEDLTNELKNQANFEQEEDWMDIKGAIVMKEAWEKARKEMIKEENHA